MAQQLKSDWLLFGTVVAMVGAGLVMIYSASSVVAQLNPHINSSFYYVAHQLVWAVVSFVALMFFKRRDYRMLQSPGLGVRIARHGAVSAIAGLFPRQQNAPLVPSGRRRDIAAVRIRQARADHFLRLLCHAEARSHQHHVGPLSRLALALAVLAATVGLGDLGHGDRSDCSRRGGLLHRRIGAQVCVRGARGRRCWWPSDLSPPSLIAWRASSGFFDPEYKVHRHGGSGRQDQEIHQPIGDHARRGLPGAAIENRGRQRRSARPWA